MDVKLYIDSKGWKILGESNTDGENWIRLAYCPFCHDVKGHFYLCEDTGQFKCHAGTCGLSGSLFTLKKHVGDLVEPATFSDMIGEQEKFKFGEREIADVKANHLHLLQDKETLLYLSSRYFTLEAVKHFQLGLETINETKWLAFPYFDVDGLKNVKYRTLPPAKKGFRRLEGGESALYNERALHQDSDEIIITEGESDCISLWGKGIKNVIGVSVGANSLKPEWIRLLDRYKRVYFVYDNDEAGTVGAQKFANRLGLARCRQIKLPPDIKDVNEFFIKKHTIEEFYTLIKQAEKLDVENVKSLGGAIREQLRNQYLGISDNKLELPWGNVNKLLNGLIPGDLIVLGGIPGVGKSTMAFNMLYHFAIGKAIPSLLFSLEMPIWRILPRIVALHKNMDSKLCSGLDVLMEAYKELQDVPFYFAYKYNKPTWNFIADTVRASVKYYGIGFVVFDNLHFMCRSLSHQTEETSIMVQNFSLLAKELSIPIVLIARPRKLGGKLIDGESLKDSADIQGDADIVLLIHRDRKKSLSGEEIEGTFESKTLIIVDKCLDGRTRVITEHGTKELRKIVNEKYSDKVLSVKNNKLVWRPIINWYKNDLNNRILYKMRFKHNRKKMIIGTEDHLILTQRGWVTMKNINDNDYIASGEPAPAYLAEQVIIGSLLGDAGISNQYNYKDEHHKSQLGLLRFKKKFLNDLGCSIAPYRTHRLLRLKKTSYIHNLYSIWYPAHKKIIPPVELYKLEDLGLAIWYADDGHCLVLNKEHFYHTQIALGNITKDEINLVQNFLQNKFNLITKCRYVGVSCAVLFFDKLEAIKLFKIISPHMPKSMHYKLPHIFRQLPKKDYTHELSETSWARVNKIKIDKLRNDYKSVYCIDVADTHNFVTTGGVVHNCRYSKGGSTFLIANDNCARFDELGS